MKRALLLTLCAALAAFYCVVLVLALRPQVSPAYRLYYLEKRLRHWNHGQGPVYRPGQALDFSQPVAQLSRRGWGPEGPGGAGIDGPEAELVFLLPPGARPGLLELGVRTAQRAGRSMSLAVLANGVPVGRAELPDAGPAQLRFTLPPDMPAGQGDLLVLRLRPEGAQDDGGPAFFVQSLTLR